MKKKIIIIVSVVFIFIAAAMTVILGIGKSSKTVNYEMAGERLSGSSGVPMPSYSQPFDSSPGMKIGTETMDVETQKTPSAIDIPADKKIIKNGNVTMKVASVDDAAQSISEIAGKNGGTVLSSSIRQSSSKIKSGTMTIKVPVDKFEKMIPEIKKVAVLVINENTSGNDVTEQYVDLQAQVKNKKAEEASFVKILESAQKIDDVLAVTKELSRTRGEIERLEGRIRFMESQTDMSTITVNLSEDQEITLTDTWRPWQLVKETVNGLLSDFQGFVNFLIVLIIRIIPVFALYGIIFFLIYRLARKIYRKFKTKKEETIEK